MRIFMEVALEPKSERRNYINFYTKAIYTLDNCLIFVKCEDTE